MKRASVDQLKLIAVAYSNRIDGVILEIEPKDVRRGKLYVEGIVQFKLD